MRRAGRFLLMLLVSLVLGCGTVQIPRPGDFPFRNTDDKFFNLYWRLEKTPEEVRAVGLVEAARVDGVSNVAVELLELNAGGTVINSAVGFSYGGRLGQWDYQPFTVTLHPKNQDDRFEPKVSSFSWWTGAGL